MLKELIVNGKPIPVPVPVKTLNSAIDWLSSTLVGADRAITRVVLDGREIDVEGDQRPIAGASRELSAKSRLEVRLDSPIDLAIQSIDALANLISVLRETLKPIAVNCWQGRPRHGGLDLDCVIDDLRLILELQDNVRKIVAERGMDLPDLEGPAHMLEKIVSTLVLAASNSDWRSCSKVMLNRLEPLLVDTAEAAAKIQIELYHCADA